MLVQLEVVSDDEQPADIADVDEVGRGLFDQLRQSGYTIKPTSTGRKGGELLFDILLTILGSIPPVLECLLIARDRLAEREGGKRSPLKITLEVNDKPVVIEASDPEDVATLIKRLQITQHDAVKIKVRVPRKRRYP
jgi:hypothetical protein